MHERGGSKTRCDRSAGGSDLVGEACNFGPGPTPSWGESGDRRFEEEPEQLMDPPRERIGVRNATGSLCHTVIFYRSCISKMILGDRV